MKRLLKNISTLALILFSTNSISQVVDYAYDPDDAFSHTVLSLLDEPRNEAPWMLIINSQEDWEAFYRRPLAYMQFPVGEAPITPVLDFDNYQVLAGGLGVKSSGGHQISVSKVYELENEMLVHVLVVRPGLNCASTSILSYPSTAILVRKTNKPFRLSVSQLINECL